MLVDCLMCIGKDVWLLIRRKVFCNHVTMIICVIVECICVYGLSTVCFMVINDQLTLLLYYGYHTVTTM